MALDQEDNGKAPEIKTEQADTWRSFGELAKALVAAAEKRRAGQ